VKGTTSHAQPTIGARRCEDSAARRGWLGASHGRSDRDRRGVGDRCRHQPQRFGQVLLSRREGGHTAHRGRAGRRMVTDRGGLGGQLFLTTAAVMMMVEPNAAGGL
jgi:hypothetical protein